MPGQVEAPQTPPGLQHKSAVAEAPIVATNDDTGEVTAVVSVTNVVDDVGDIILPGAYKDTLARRRPKGVWSHSWKDWVARTESITEYAPGDPQLKVLLDEAGASLPPQAGALVVKCKFNFDDPDSKKAYSKVKFFSETGECQWSIGYAVPPGKGVRDSKGVRRISSLNLYEYSPVLFGAASQSTSLSVKAADPGAWPEDEAIPVVAEDEHPPAGLTPVDQIEAPTDADLDDVEAVAREAVGDGTEEPAAPEADEPPVDDVEVKRKFTTAQRDDAADKGQAMGDGSFPIKTEQDLRNAIQAYGRAKDKDAAKRHIIARAKSLGLTNLLPDDWKIEAKSASEVLDDLQRRLAVVEAKYDTSPVGSPGDKENWVDRAGGLPSFIRAIAHALIRQGKSESQAIQIAVGTVKRWAAGGGDVTEATRAKAAAALAQWEKMKAGSGAKTSEDATDDATSTVDAAKPAADDVELPPVPDTVAELLGEWSPTAEVGEKAAHLPSTPQMMGTEYAVETDDLPHLAGTQEEAREVLRVALTEHLPEGKDAMVVVDGTFDDRVIASVHGADETVTYRIPYAFKDASTVTLGTPREVRLALAAEGDGGDLPIPGALLDGVETALLGAKLLTGGVEVKAGRVLSGSNATRIASAVENLIAVLRSAGVDVGTPESAAAAEATEQKDVEPEAEALFAEGLAEAARLRAALLRG